MDSMGLGGWVDQVSTLHRTCAKHLGRFAGARSNLLVTAVRVVCLIYFSLAVVFVAKLSELKLGELLDTPPPGLDEAIAISKVHPVFLCYILAVAASGVQSPHFHFS